MPDGNVSRDMFDGRTQVCDERFARDLERIERIEDTQNEIATCQTKIVEIIATQTKQIDKMDTRIAALEAKPSNAWDAVKNAAISALVGGAIAYVVAAITTSVNI